VRTGSARGLDRLCVGRVAILHAVASALHPAICAPSPRAVRDRVCLPDRVRVAGSDGDILMMGTGVERIGWSTPPRAGPSFDRAGGWVRRPDRSQVCVAILVKVSS
jgi:hypothetical protein